MKAGEVYSTWGSSSALGRPSRRSHVNANTYLYQLSCPGLVTVVALEGTFVVETPDGLVSAKPGESLLVPRGVRHRPGWTARQSSVGANGVSIMFVSESLGPLQASSPCCLARSGSIRRRSPFACASTCRIELGQSAAFDAGSGTRARRS